MSYRNRAFLILSVLAAGTIFLTTACKKSNTTANPNGALSATIADTAWYPYYTTALYYSGQGLYQINGVAAAATKGDSSFLQISFSAPIQVGKVISTDTASVDYYDSRGYFDWGAGTNSGNGVAYITVTSYDSVNHKIAGSIKGSLSSGLAGASWTDTVLLNTGEFNLTYTVLP